MKDRNFVKFRIQGILTDPVVWPKKRGRSFKLTSFQESENYVARYRHKLKL